MRARAKERETQKKREARETGAVDEAGDVAVEVDEVQVELCRLHVKRILHEHPLEHLGFCEGYTSNEIPV